MADRADTANACGDTGHFVERPAFGEFFEAAHLGDVEVGALDVAILAQLNGDLGVSLDARDGIDGDFSHGVSYPNFTSVGLAARPAIRLLTTPRMASGFGGQPGRWTSILTNSC